MSCLEVKDLRSHLQFFPTIRPEAFVEAGVTAPRLQAFRESMGVLLRVVRVNWHGYCLG
ncbi:hypothetical protein [Acaryochloris sp. IP29b_bin.148]|uniref:hypothetical protein n=1 Tax=Acaryochloris sp. IP29b_bin.148 TaxID=2969218 RepID=UPI002609BF09|nr:hypothetical protein [Acaryochloris sp. IP29b_bin.148]